MLDPAYLRRAAEMLGFGGGCHNGACALGGTPLSPMDGLHTNGGCHCLDDTLSGRRSVRDRVAVRDAIAAAAKSLMRHDGAADPPAFKVGECTCGPDGWNPTCPHLA